MSGEIRAGLALLLVGAAMFLGGLLIGQPFLGLGVVVAVIGLLVLALDLVRSDSTPPQQPVHPPAPPYYPPPPPQQQQMPPPPPNYRPPGT